jgi:hypothetical protein
MISSGLPWKWAKPASGLLGVLAIAVLLISCGDDSGPQPPVQWDLGQRYDTGGSGGCQNCFGCCTPAGQCKIGNTIDACGKNGGSCRTCTLNQQCVQNECQSSTPTCSASDCFDGCCSFSGVCIRPPNETNCGIGGAACTPCTAGKVCNKTTGACDDPVSSKYEVTLVSATIKIDCDVVPFNTCDPYAIVSLVGSGHTAQSKRLGGTQSPQWDEKLFEATEQDLLTRKMEVKIMDDDGWPYEPELVDQCMLTITQKELADGKIVAPCGTLGAEKVVDLTISFKPVTTQP